MATATAAASRHGVLSAELELAENRVAQLQAELARARAHRDKTADALGEADSAQAAAQRELRRARTALEDLRNG
jgi:chromosome segregation ATPase